MNKRMVIFLSVLVVAMIACNLTGIGGTQQAPVSTEDASGNEPGGILQPAGTPPANPVNMNEGLESLNSYQMIIAFKSIGPDPAQSSTTTVDVQRSKDLDASLTRLSMSAVENGEEGPSNTDSSIYRIGNDQCSGNEDEWEWTSLSPAESEMLGVIKNMIGIAPLIDNPTFVGQETVNGIASNHFTFKVSSLGVKSGAVVNLNQGDYWLAVDGQYIVKYLLVIEESTDPQTILHTEVSIDLNQINQPISIAFPQGCLDASLVTPEP